MRRDLTLAVKKAGVIINGFGAGLVIETRTRVLISIFGYFDLFGYLLLDISIR